jgi:hypothetical protein
VRAHKVGHHTGDDDNYVLTIVLYNSALSGDGTVRPCRILHCKYREVYAFCNFTLWHMSIICFVVFCLICLSFCSVRLYINVVVVRSISGLRVLSLDEFIPHVMWLVEHGVDRYSETNVMHFFFSLLTIKGLSMFRALLAHPQEALHKRHIRHIACVLCQLAARWCNQLT